MTLYAPAAVLFFSSQAAGGRSSTYGSQRTARLTITTTDASPSVIIHHPRRISAGYHPPFPTFIRRLLSTIPDVYPSG